ncbi:hypothetical protein [Aestuariivirga sp.]|uniref:hypothetical protein n=1 Tax=Aestuariivirga sp. TaxID=2650926 RepID=UPI0039E4BF89
MLKTRQYIEAPPTVSRLLTDPLISKPFAVAMIISALCLVIGIIQAAAVLLQHVLAFTRHRGWRIAAIGAFLASEMTALAGMIVLSQYTGDIAPEMHDVGSYMLFFGHAIGITLAGLLVAALLKQGDDNGLPLSPRLRPLPRMAHRVFWLSLLFGIVYFSGKVLPDAFFFIWRTVFSGLEIIVIFAFLTFLMAFRRLLGVPVYVQIGPTDGTSPASLGGDGEHGDIEGGYSGSGAGHATRWRGRGAPQGAGRRRR